MREGTRRRPLIIAHRARPAGTQEKEDNMESYRNQIIKMLDTIEDAALMRMIHNVLRAILMSR